MTVAALSSAGLSRYVSAFTSASASQQAFQWLQQSLSAGNLTAAKAAFNTYRQLNSSLNPTADASSSAEMPSGSSQLVTDLTSLGRAIDAGNLRSAQSAFSTMQSDMKTSPSQAMANAETTVTQTVQWIDDLLSLASPSVKPSTQADPLMSILDSIFGLNPSPKTDPMTSFLEIAYGSESAANQLTATHSPLAANGNAGSGASVNAYA